MRDKRRDNSYFEQFITTKAGLIDKTGQALLEGKVAEKQANRSKFRNFGFRLEALVAKYSKGDSKVSLKESVIEIIKRLPKKSDPINTKIKRRIGKETIYIDQYMAEPYERMLRLLSLAYLFNVPDSDFKNSSRNN